MDVSSDFSERWSSDESDGDDSDGSSIPPRSMTAGEDEGHGQAFRRVLRCIGDPDEVTWWRLWQTVQMSVEVECCAVRERERRLRGEVSVRRRKRESDSRDARVEDASTGTIAPAATATSTRAPVASHERLGARRPRERGDSTLGDDAAAVGASTPSGVSILRRAPLVRARLPQDCVDRRCVTIRRGVRGVPGFEEKSAEETMCSIYITPVDTPGERLCLLDCGHAFHLSCVRAGCTGPSIEL